MKLKKHSHTIKILLFLVLSGNYSQAQSFIEVAQAVGISGGYGFASATEAGGVSFVDFNNDGWDDLTFCTENTQLLKIYQNVNGTFQAISPSGITAINEKKTVQWVDYDNDGDQDLYLVIKPQPNKLYRNDGSMTFTDVTSAAGLPDPPSSPSTWAANNSASFCDYDRDGDLDFYITRYRMPGALIDTNSFYRNNGDGTFTDVTTMTGTSNGLKESFCSTFFDYDNDGWEDLYVVNDRYLFENTLYHNNGDGTFTDVSAASGTNIAVDAMNAGIGDYDHNGYLDIYITNSGPSLQGPSYLFANQGDGTFIDMASASGTSFNRNGWGGNFFDFDHDLDLDLYVSTSWVGFSYPNGMFVNDSNGIYTEPYYSSGGLLGKDTIKSLTNVIGDLNNDGYYDIAVCNDNIFDFTVWKNTTVTSNHWFKLFLIGTHANRDAIGAWIEMWIDGEKYIRSIQSQEAYCGQNSRRLIMSTGTHTSIDSLVIKWPIKVGNVPYHKQVVPGSQIMMETVDTITEPVICHTVTSPLNDGLGSLRAAVECAESGDTIVVKLNPGDTIMLADNPITIAKSLLIKSGSNIKQPIVAPPSQPALIINAGDTVVLKSLYIFGTETLIENHGNLILKEVDVHNLQSATNSSLVNYGQATVSGQVDMWH